MISAGPSTFTAGITAGLLTIVHLIAQHDTAALPMSPDMLNNNSKDLLDHVTYDQCRPLDIYRSALLPAYSLSFTSSRSMTPPRYPCLRTC